MAKHLESRFDEYIYEIGALKKTLCRLSLAIYGRVLPHLSPIQSKLAI
jgi:hypothetical protein